MANTKRQNKPPVDDTLAGQTIPPNPGFVTQEEFTAFREQQAKNTIDILEAINGLKQPVIVQAPVPTPSRAYAVTAQQQPERQITPDDASVMASSYTLNPAHQAIFNEFFDPADGFTASFNYPYFEIIVPDKFSNADPAWKAYYKVDRRVKFIKHDNIEGGMRDWCRMVAANLKYNKNIKTK